MTSNEPNRVVETLPPKVSVIICTFNRAESLRETLASLARMEVPADLSWELIVVDNNSRDTTRAVVERFYEMRKLNIRYIFEPKQGLSYARNRGVSEARGRVVSFLDDDVLVATDWLVQVGEAFLRHNPACVGGRVLLSKDLPLPAWWDSWCRGPAGEFDRGDSIIEGCHEFLGNVGIGANLSFLRSMFDRYGHFRVDLGRTADNLLMGEETEFVRRLRAGGERLLYFPQAAVFHCPDMNRFSKRYIRRWCCRIGEWRLFEDESLKPRGVKILGVPRWKYKQAIKDLWKALILTLLRRSKDAFRHEGLVLQFVGYFWASVKNGSKVRSAKSAGV